jgi:hypothetical protein
MTLWKKTYCAIKNDSTIERMATLLLSRFHLLKNSTISPNANSGGTGMSHVMSFKSMRASVNTVISGQ